MRLAIMQPYFFPYIGYWQLIHACESFILLDDVQYIRGWINRNKILKQSGGWQYITVPLKKHSRSERICNIKVFGQKDWRHMIFKKIQYYKNKTQHFNEIYNLLYEILYDQESNEIAKINRDIIYKISRALGLKKNILMSSELSLNYENIIHAEDRILKIAKYIGASEYLNPIGGASLYDADKFYKNNIELNFLVSEPSEYFQGHGISEPSLSIIDVLMFNGFEGTANLLERYKILKGANSSFYITK